MSENITITLSRDEGLVLFEFFARFCENDDDFTLRHAAEYLAFMRLSAQLDKMFVEPFDPNYNSKLHVTELQQAIVGKAPGVHDDLA